MRDKLQEIQKKIAVEEERVRLLKNLQSKGLTTRDVASFINNQAKIRSVDKYPDRHTALAAMSAKIRDSNKALKMKRETRHNIKEEYKTLVNNKGYQVKKIMKDTRTQAINSKQLKEKIK